jgi:hypothetical protein
MDGVRRGNRVGEAVRPAGTLLVKIARLLFDESVLTRVVYPTISDLQEEVREAGTDPRWRLLARWRGYRAFWGVVVAPRSRSGAGR